MMFPRQVTPALTAYGDNTGTAPAGCFDNLNDEGGMDSATPPSSFYRQPTMLTW
jgi:hypothetical protein